MLLWRKVRGRQQRQIDGLRRSEASCDSCWLASAGSDPQPFSTESLCRQPGCSQFSVRGSQFAETVKFRAALSYRSDRSDGPVRRLSTQFLFAIDPTWMRVPLRTENCEPRTETANLIADRRPR